MKTRYLSVVSVLQICLPAILAGSAKAADKPQNDWQKVLQALQTLNGGVPIAATAKQDGPPLREGERIIFRVRAPGAVKVYFAANFNDWARNKKGKITDPIFSMRRGENGIWYTRTAVPSGACQYSFVIEDKDGVQKWMPDPHVPGRSKSGGASVLEVSSIALAESPKLVAGLTLKPVVFPLETSFAKLDVRAERVWGRPDQANPMLVRLEESEGGADMKLEFSVETPFGVSVHTSSHACKSGENRILLPSITSEGGFLVRVSLARAGKIVKRGQAILSVVQNVADDLRYGFYASYKLGGDYDARAAMLARLHVNAVEFYDYFPAHGYYAPREPEYKFEPLGIRINALDIQRKIEAGHGRNILSLAYVAAYAASESVYRKYPYPMTDKDGVAKVFNGQIMTEAEADLQKKAKWFWLMNVAKDSPWHEYILAEFGRTLDNSPDDLVSFDGFEIDTYGDRPDAKFYAKNSSRNGDLLRDVLHDFVGDVQSLTHKIKSYGLVSFNSVNGFGVEQMTDVTDFLFLEIWRAHTDNLEALVDICFRNRAQRCQRVILKIYPADMLTQETAWPVNTLRRLLAATMTGAGSLMVLGEPDEKTGEMHALNTLYYPDHKPVAAANEAVLAAYYAHDAMLLGYTHGREVENTELEMEVPGCITRTYAARAKHALTIQLFQPGAEPRWTANDAPEPPAKVNTEVALSLPGNVAPKSVFYVTPDVSALQTPVKLDFAVANGKLRTLLPELHVHGTLLLNY